MQAFNLRLHATSTLLNASEEVLRQQPIKTLAFWKMELYRVGSALGGEAGIKGPPVDET
jgi:hypothetical protein